MMLVSMVAFYFYFYIEMTLAIDMGSKLSMKAMNKENQLLVKMNRLSLRHNRVKFQGFKKLTDCFRGIYGICLKSIKKNRKITTCNRLDLE